jgi:hypothetical protein
LYSSDSGLAAPVIPPFVEEDYAVAIASYADASAHGFLCAAGANPASIGYNRVSCFTLPINSVVDPSLSAIDRPDIQILNGYANNTIQCCMVESRDLKFLPNGNLVVAYGPKYQQAAAVKVYALPAGDPVAQFYDVSQPYAIAFDSAGNTYVADAGSGGGADGKILQFPPNPAGGVGPIRTIPLYAFSFGIAIGK